MTTPRRYAFINAFKTVNEANDFLKEIVGPGLVIHLYCRDHKTGLHSELFTVCNHSDVDSIKEELDEVEVRLTEKTRGEE
jgi:hypothetical protein